MIHSRSTNEITQSTTKPRAIRGKRGDGKPTDTGSDGGDSSFSALSLLSSSLPSSTSSSLAYHVHRHRHHQATSKVQERLVQQFFSSIHSIVPQRREDEDDEDYDPGAENDDSSECPTETPAASKHGSTTTATTTPIQIPRHRVRRTEDMATEVPSLHSFRKMATAHIPPLDGESVSSSVSPLGTASTLSSTSKMTTSPLHDRCAEEEDYCKDGTRMMDLWSTNNSTSGICGDEGDKTPISTGCSVSITKQQSTDESIEAKHGSRRRSVSKFFKLAAAELSDDDDDDDHEDESDEDEEEVEKTGNVDDKIEHVPVTEAHPAAQKESPQYRAFPKIRTGKESLRRPAAAAAAATGIHPSGSIDQKRELLLLFLLQHVARELNPDPMYFAQLAKLLLAEGLLTDKKFADFGYLKSQTKEFMREIISFLPSPSPANVPIEGATPGTESMPLRRSNSTDSFLMANRNFGGIESGDDAMGEPAADSTSKHLATWVHNTAAQHPFLDYLFASPSRFDADFVNRRRIGRGAFGSVYRVQHRVDGMTYAVKRIKFSFRNARELEAAYKRVVREVKSLAQLDHPNIVRYNQAWFEPVRQEEREREARERQEQADDDADDLLGGYDDYDEYSETEELVTSPVGDDRDVGYESTLFAIGQHDETTTTVSGDVQNDIEIDVADGYDDDDDGGGGGDGDDEDDDETTDHDESCGLEFELDEDLEAAAQSRGMPLNEGKEEEKGASGGLQPFGSDIIRGRPRQRPPSPPGLDLHDIHSFSPKDMSYLQYAIEKKNAAMMRRLQSPSPMSPVTPGSSAFAPALDMRQHSSVPRTSLHGASALVGRQSQPPPGAGSSSVCSQNAVVESLVTEQSMEAVKNLLNEMFDQRKNKFEMCLFIQMQLCSSETLEDYLWSDQRVKEGIVNLREALLLFAQVCQAVAYIHSKGLIHRDIKPSNLFVAQNNVIKLGDFGLAKICHEMNVEPNSTSPVSPSDAADCASHGATNCSDSSTSDGDAARGPIVKMVDTDHSTQSTSHTHTSGVGTPTYASPEQLNDTAYDEKTDIFSLGLILFELLHPFSTRTERAIVMSKLRDGIIPQVMADRYPNAMKLVRSCTDADPAKRPSAQAVLQAVYSFLHVQGTSIPSVPAPVPIPAITSPTSSASGISAALSIDTPMSTSPEILLQQIQDRDNEIDRLKKEIDALREYQRQQQQQLQEASRVSP